MRKIAAPIAAALCALAATSNADADNVTFTGFAHGSQTVTYTIPSLTVPGGHKTATVNAGGFSTIHNGGPSFTSYCVDLYQTISFGVLYSDYAPVGAAHAFANSDAYADLGRLYASAGVIADAVHEAAFQIAVWEIAYETDSTYGLGNGVATFAGGSADPAALVLASSWLAGLGSGGLHPSIGALDSHAHQDVVYAPVPEASTVMLMLTGLLGMGAVARRRRSAGAR